MIPVGILSIISLLYFGLLFAVASYADKRRYASRSITSNASVYTLSLAVFYTTGTFYGSVTMAATSGVAYMTIYVGVTLMAFSWWFLLRKMVRISKEQNIVSIADFIASRYGNSAILGSFVTIFAILGITPYIALQLKTVAHTFDILTTPQAAGQGFRHFIPTPPAVDTACIVALFLSLFAIHFGARRLAASERHEGMVAAIAVQSVVKLIAIAAVGLFVTYGMFDGFSDIFTRFAARFPEHSHLFQLESHPYPFWFTRLLLSMMAVMFLPSQFHIMVVENSGEEQIKGAMWRFPAYTFLFALFVFPIAMGGIIANGGDTSAADSFIIQLPLLAGHPWLAILVFLGGFSAAAGMVMLESMALSIMILNHLAMPVILKLRIGGADISGILITIERVSIAVVIFLGYLYYRIIGEAYILVATSSAMLMAAAQFMPAMIGGLYWKRATRRGAVTGLLLGFIVWFHTLMVPAFVRSGWLTSDILKNGPFGIGFLRPLELFGLSGLDMLSHSLFWSMLFNLGAFIALSLLTEAGRSEAGQAVKFVDVFKVSKEPARLERIDKAPTVVEFVELMSKFIGEKQSHAAIVQYLEQSQIDAKGSLSEYELPVLKRYTEHILAGSVGASAAGLIVDSYLEARGSRMEEVFNIFGTVTLSRTASREQLGVLYKAAKVVASGADLQTIQDNILDLLREQFRFDACVIRIVDEERQMLTVRNQKGMSARYLANADREINMDTYTGMTFVTNSVTVINDADLTEKADSDRITRSEGIKAFALAPITIEGRPIGVLSAYSKSAKGIFSDEFIELFKSLADQIGIARRNAYQTEKIIEAKEREKELQIARTIQLGLLPDGAPKITGISLAGICIPAREVGGDYYDFLPRGERGVDLLIADVSGHNVGAALIMAETRTFVQAVAKNIRGCGELMALLNDFLHDDLSRAELFITMFYMSYDADMRRLSFASAGHNPPILWRAASRSCEQLDAEGLILGFMRGVVFEEKQIQLMPGDLLLLYTDGITEAANPAGELFGEERLCALLGANHALPHQQIIDNILGQARLFTGTQGFSDDISLVVMRVEEHPNP